MWAQRTPEGFRFDVKAYSLLTGHPTKVQSLWKDLRDELPEEVTEKRNLYAKHLSPEAMDEAWRRFEAALRPLHEAGRLGAVLFQYPPWFRTRAGTTAPRSRRSATGCRTIACASSCARPDGWRRSATASGRWACSRMRELTFVCVDAPEASELPRLFALTTPDLFVVRFHGRSDSTWKCGARTAAERFRYLYSEDELRELAGPIAQTAAEAHESHLLMNNCYRDYGVRNAAELRDLLG